jgi:hypothetical protein
LSTVTEWLARILGTLSSDRSQFCVPHQRNEHACDSQTPLQGNPQVNNAEGAFEEFIGGGGLRILGRVSPLDIGTRRFRCILSKLTVQKGRSLLIQWR